MTNDRLKSEPPQQTFAQMDLSKVMLRALDSVGYIEPSPIQAGIIPPALEGFDLMGQARTGTGKTASFAIPILEQLDPLQDCRTPQALILVPTRELAGQVRDEFVKLAEGVPTSITLLSGGHSIQNQTRQLQRGTQVVVGTPGRVLDHLSRRTLDLRRLWCIVLDEADRMLDIGFRFDIEKILRRCPEDRQTLLLSATFPDDVRELANRYMFEPKMVDCSANNMAVETIEQHYFLIEASQKYDALVKLLHREKPPQAIIFCRTKLGTAKLHRRLAADSHGDPILESMRIETIHGNMNQSQRDAVFRRLRSGDIQLLVATDVLGRGIDVSTISHIINYDLPTDTDDYVHRVGRTGRMGRDGVAFTFVSKNEGDQLTSIEQRMNIELQRDYLEGIESPATPRSMEVPVAEPKKGLGRHRKKVTRRR